MIRVVAALAVSLAAGVAGAGSPVSAGEEIDRVVAVIRSPAVAEPRVVTLSRLEDETRIALISRGGLLAASQRLDELALAAGLEWIVDQTLLSDEAARLQVFDSEGDLSGEEIAGFRARFGRPAEYQAFLQRWDISEEEVATVLRRMVRVKRYVDSRVSHAAQVSESEVSTWLDQHAAEIGRRDRELARARLTDERVGAEVRALVRELRARAEVRLLAKFAASAPGAQRPALD